MYGTTISREQFDTVNRLFSSLDRPQGVSGVQYGTTVVTSAPFQGQTFLNVTFLSGYGNRSFHIAKDGSSAPVETDGTSALIR